MKVIKNINNNISLCLDGNHQEVIVLGKGIGFTKPPYEIEVSKIQRTFYDIDPMYIDMIQNISEDMIELAASIIDYARSKVEYLLNSSIIFTLADHLNFSIQRYQNDMVLAMPLYYDIKSLYESEYEIGCFALKLIKRRMNITLPKEEVTSIALHLINAGASTLQKGKKQDSTLVIEEIKQLIETHFGFTIAVDEFNYSRFVSHLQYLLKRGEQGKSISSENYKLYASIKDSFPDVYTCALKINEYLHIVCDFNFNEEELLYLMLHINRLCVREDCYR